MRKSRQFSERVEQKFFKDANSFRARLWKWSGWGILAVLVTVLFFAVRGDRQIYEAGPVSHSHRFIENDCAQCHDTWAPLSRFVFFDRQISSVSETKCQTCHSGLPHQAQLSEQDDSTSAHGSLGCASCHREHRGDESLIQFANQQCINCHHDLNHHGGSEQFAQHIGSFGDPAAPDAHPEFAIHRLLADPATTPVSLEAKTLILETDQESMAKSSPPVQPGDTSKIYFNHKKHLKAKYNQQGELIEGLKGPNGELIDLSKSCSACHQPDATFGLMQPVKYDLHCKSCHELTVGLNDPALAAKPQSDAIERISIPHQNIPTVIGFLTQQFTLKALADKSKSKPLAPPDRLLPGISYRPPLDEEAAETIDNALAQAEVRVANSLHALVGREAQGGCRFCHYVTQDATVSISMDEGSLSHIASMKIVKPNMPTRWMPHANFSHDSHRLLNCQDCHQHTSGSTIVPVYESKSTTDILMPTMELCSKCHSERPTTSPTFANLGPIQSAGTNCTLCHNYHDRSIEHSGLSQLQQSTK